MSGPNVYGGARPRYMSGSSRPLQRIVQALEDHYGEPAPPPVTDPLGLILWENVGYLVNDERRMRAFLSLEEHTGLDARDIAAAPDEVLLEIAELGGMHPVKRVQKLRDIAHLCLDRMPPHRALKLPPAEARRELKRFPGIGAPGAEKILLFSGTESVLALESNGLRVLVRLGHGEEQSNYSGTYRSVQKALADQLPDDCAWLIRTYQLLRQHGKELCKTSRPACTACPLKSLCAYACKGRRP